MLRIHVSVESTTAKLTGFLKKWRDVLMALSPTEKLTVLQPHIQLGDPHEWTDARNRLSIRFAIYESLVRYGDQGLYRPALAQSWTLEDDARTWTFNLRTGVSFHNGDTLKAQDVVATLERARDPEMAGELGTKGLCQSYLEGATIEAVSEHTVRLITPQPMADLLDLLVEVPIVPQSAIAGLPNSALGSGPYRLVEAGDDCIVMEAFEDYWGGRPPVKQVYWQAEPNAQQRVEALLAGEADLITEVTPEGRRIIEATDQATVVARESSVCTVFMCNCRSGVCADRRVRQALNYALDVPALIETVMEGAARPINGPLASMHFGYDPATPPYPYDPDKARELLAKAGYADGLKLVLDVPTVLPDEAPRLAQYMAEQYAKVGITTEIKEFTDRPGYAEMVKAKQIDDACCFDSSPLSTYRVMREKFHSRIGGPWWQGYSNPEVDTLLDQAQATADNARRRDLYRRAYRLIRDDAPWIFLYNSVIFWGVGPRARGWTAEIDGLVRLV